MGFEPTRAEPIGLAVQRLNHSATVSWSHARFIADKFERFAGSEGENQRLLIFFC